MLQTKQEVITRAMCAQVINNRIDTIEVCRQPLVDTLKKVYPVECRTCAVGLRQRLSGYWPIWSVAIRLSFIALGWISCRNRRLITGGGRKLSKKSFSTPVLRQNLVAIDIVDFLQPSSTLYWYEGITILAVLLCQSLTQRSMQFGSWEPCAHTENPIRLL